jgi:hypothetical protein
MRNENPQDPIKDAESKLNGITKLGVYVDEQKERAKAAKDHIEKIDNSNKDFKSAKKDYLTGQYESILAEGRNFSASDKAYLQCIKSHGNTPTEVSVLSGDDPTYWVLACQDQGIHL